MLEFTDAGVMQKRPEEPGGGAAPADGTGAYSSQAEMKPLGSSKEMKDFMSGVADPNVAVLSASDIDRYYDSVTFQGGIPH